MQVRVVRAKADALGCQGGICDPNRRVARLAWAGDAGQAPARNSPDAVENLLDRVSFGDPEVHWFARSPGAQHVKGRIMGLRQVGYADIVAYSRAIRSRIVRAKT
jgi:hypothetical protein